MASTELSVIARRLGLAALDSSNLEASAGERRQPATSCDGCNTSASRLVFMSNGGNYCVDCARGLAEAFGYGPVGLRAEDLTTLG